MATKSFDCVELQHKGGDRICEATEEMTHRELLAWWQQHNKQFQAARKARRAKRDKAGASR